MDKPDKTRKPSGGADLAVIPPPPLKPSTVRIVESLRTQPPAVQRIVLAAVLAAASTGGNAGGGATGGATEITQIMNHAELISQVGEAVQTTSNTLMSAQATMQQLRQLAPSTIAQMAGVPIDKVQKLAQAYTVMSQAKSVYDDAADVLKRATADSQRLNIQPSELLRYKAEAAYKYGGVYRQTYDQEQAKLARLSDVSSDVQQQAQQVASIDANVKGIQFLAGQNVKVQATLADISDSIATANANAAMEAENEKRAAARSADREAAMLEARRRAVETPTGKLKLPHELTLVK